MKRRVRVALKGGGAQPGGKGVVLGVSTGLTKSPVELGVRDCKDPWVRTV